MCVYVCVCCVRVYTYMHTCIRMCVYTHTHTYMLGAAALSHLTSLTSRRVTCEWVTSQVDESCHIDESCHVSTGSTGWQRLVECLKLQVIFRKRATNYRSLLRKMTCEDKASYGSSPPCSTYHWGMPMRHVTYQWVVSHVNESCHIAAAWSHL